MAANINSPPKETPAEAVAAARAGEGTSFSQYPEEYIKRPKNASGARFYSVNRWLLVEVNA